MEIMMVKYLSLSALTLGMIIAGFGAKADPVTLNITGNVVASPCQINSDSVTRAVDLGQEIQASTLQNSGSSSDWVNFDIKLDNCPSGTTKVVMTMHGNSDALSMGDLYQNTGSATNLGVQLQSLTADQLGDGKSLTGVIANNAYTYNLRARAYSTNGSVTPGTISSVVTATFIYQ